MKLAEAALTGDGTGRLAAGDVPPALRAAMARPPDPDALFAFTLDRLLDAVLESIPAPTFGELVAGVAAFRERVRRLA